MADPGLVELVHKLTDHLVKIKISTQKRNKERNEHNLAFQFSMGVSSNAANATGFELGTTWVREIPGRPGRAAFVRPVLEDPRLPAWKKEIWKLCVDLITKIDPQWAGVKEEFAVSISKINSPFHFVRNHVDKDDVCRQVVFFLGDFSGAYLRLFSHSGDFEDVNLFPGMVLEMDGRLPHELVLKDFVRVRHGLFFYKPFDSRLSSPTAITSNYRVGTIEY